MQPSTNVSTPIVLWQGFRHRWQYNHRVNRIGSYIEHKLRSGGSCEAEAVHTAASGTGPDRADFTDVFTGIRAKGVGFQPGVCELKLVTVEEKLTPFRLVNRVELEPELVGKESYTVVLNGFDLYADGDAKKLMTLMLEVTAPELDDSGTILSFSANGAFRVDCSSIECDRIMQEMRAKHDRGWPVSVTELKQQVLDDFQDPEKCVEYTVGKLSVVDDRVSLLRDQVNYILRVHYVIIAGDGADVHIAHTEPVFHGYRWDKRTELPSTLADRKPANTPQIKGEPGFRCFTFALKQIIVHLYRRELGRTIFWRKDIAMHLLEWNMAICGMQEPEVGSFTCALDLFFKNWRKCMWWSRLPFSIFAYRDAGEAQFAAQLTLLQFKDADILQQGSHNGSIHWPGGDREAIDNPASTHKRRLRIL